MNSIIYLILFFFWFNLTIYSILTAFYCFNSINYLISIDFDIIRWSIIYFNWISIDFLIYFNNQCDFNWIIYLIRFELMHSNQSRDLCRFDDGKTKQQQQQQARKSAVMRPGLPEIASTKLGSATRAMRLLWLCLGVLPALFRETGAGYFWMPFTPLK